MEVGIGLPNAVPGTTGEQLVDWAKAAEDAGFSSLGTIDRVVYPNYDPLVGLSAAAAVTERIRLATSVLLGPLHGNPAVIAKQMLSLDALAGGGRAVLGIGLGAREDDYEASGVPTKGRGAWLDKALETIRHIFDGEGGTAAKIGPRPLGERPSLIVGGTADASFERAARFADGWFGPGSGPDEVRSGVEKIAAAWGKHGREGEPRTPALAYFSLGPDAEADAERSLRDYYAWLGDEISGMIAGSAAKDAATVKGYLSAFEDAGCDELIFCPSSGDPEQVGLLAEAAGL